MSKPRIALCISGQPRSYKEAYPYIKKNIIDANSNDAELDVFIHCWYDPDLAGVPFKETSEHVKNVPVVVKNAPEEIKLLYKPKSMKVDLPENFDYRIKHEYLQKRDTTNPVASFSMWTSIYRCNELKKEYEKNHNFKYDYVIRGRFDCITLNPVLVTSYDSNAFHVNGIHETSTSVQDCLFLSSSNNIDLVAKMTDFIPELFDIQQFYNNEMFLSLLLKRNNIATKHHPWHVILIRGNGVFPAICKYLTYTAINLSIRMVKKIMYALGMQGIYQQVKKWRNKKNI